MLLPLLLAAAAPADGSVIALVKDERGRQCLPDKSLCLQLSAAEDNAVGGLLAIYASENAADAEQPLPPLADGDAPELWPTLISVRSLPGDAPGTRRYLAGILGRQSTMYSGGGGSAARLHLYEFVTGANPALGAELLDLAWDGSLMIRACFSEKDMKDRLEACHDEYDFTSTLSAAPADGTKLPALTYRAVATTFPRTSRRSEDNSAAKLKRADLVRAEDPACTYERTLHYNAATARYEMDRPLPDCSDYTTP
ncbi:MAG: hypothetical protein J7499_01450 [Sphingopyxis sp.]|nr:hypothetical protein [Sphingopyxis sp.]